MAMSIQVRRLLAPGMLVLTVGFASPAFGAGDADRAAARAASYEGLQAYQQGDFATAVDRFGRAYDVVKVPTAGLWYARALVKVGRLVEAAERYGEVLRFEAKTGKIAVQKEAQGDAAQELAALEPRIPTLKVIVKGLTDTAEVRIDNSPVPGSLLGLARPLDPGNHEVVATGGGAERRADIALAESDHKTLELDFTSNETGTPIAASVINLPGAAPGPQATKVDLSPHAERGATQRTIGWVSLGVGGVGVALGVATGLMAGAKKSTLDSSGECKSNKCLASQDSNLDSYNTLLTLSTVGFVAGGLGIAAGTTLLLTAPSSKNEARAQVWLGAGSAGVEGSF